MLNWKFVMSCIILANLIINAINGYFIGQFSIQRLITLIYRINCPPKCLEEFPFWARVIGNVIYSDVSSLYFLFCDRDPVAVCRCLPRHYCKQQRFIQYWHSKKTRHLNPPTPLLWLWMILVCFLHFWCESNVVSYGGGKSSCIKRLTEYSVFHYAPSFR